MPTSGSTNYKSSRKELITASLRTIGVLGQGLLPSDFQLSEANVALNYLIKELNVSHGMPIWKIKTCDPITMVAGQSAYTVGLDDGTDIQQDAPLKILNAWIRTTQNTDQPLNLISKSIYDQLSSKTAQGAPNQLFYNPPGGFQGSEMKGTINLFLTPDSTAVSAYTLYFTGHYSFDNMQADSDFLDFPSYWHNAIRWALADQLAFEYGLGITERAQIGKKAEYHVQKAMEGSPEDGSLFIQPYLYQPNPQ